MKIKKVLALLLSLCMMFGLCFVTAGAAYGETAFTSIKIVVGNGTDYANATIDLSTLPSYKSSMEIPVKVMGVNADGSEVDITSKVSTDTIGMMGDLDFGPIITNDGGETPYYFTFYPYTNEANAGDVIELTFASEYSQGGTKLVAEKVVCNLTFKRTAPVTMLVKNSYDLELAIQNSTNEGDVLKLDADIDAAKMLVKIVADRSVTLDLNGHILSRTVAAGESGKIYPAVYVTAGKLTVKDSVGTGKIVGKINNQLGVSSAVAVAGGAFQMDSGTLASGGGSESQTLVIMSVDAKRTVTINGGKIDASSADTLEKNNAAICIFGNGNTEELATTLIINGGEFLSTGFVITGNGTAENSGTKIVIKGGTFTNADGNEVVPAIYHPQVGTLDISGGEFNGIEVKAGTVNITGGSFYGNGPTTHDDNSNGNSTSGYALALVENANYGKGSDAVVKISGGNFAGEIEIIKDTEREGAEELVVSGGSFIHDPSKYLAKDLTIKKDNSSDFIFTVVNPKAPNTGDSSVMSIAVVLMSMSILGAAILIVATNRKRGKN